MAAESRPFIRFTRKRGVMCSMPSGRSVSNEFARLRDFAFVAEHNFRGTNQPGTYVVRFWTSKDQ